MAEKPKKPPPMPRKVGAKASVKPTDSVSIRSSDSSRDKEASRKAVATNHMVAAMPFNKHKASEHGDASRKLSVIARRYWPSEQEKR